MFTKVNLCRFYRFLHSYGRFSRFQFIYSFCKVCVDFVSIFTDFCKFGLFCRFLICNLCFRITDESLKRYARLHRQSRFPSITWRHPKNQSILLRGSSFLGKGVMGMIKRHHDGMYQATAHTEVNSTVEAELYITSIIQNTPRAMVRPDSAW